MIKKINSLKAVLLFFLCAFTMQSYAGCCDWVKNVRVIEYGHTWDPTGIRIKVEPIDGRGSLKFGDGSSLNCSQAAEDGWFYYPSHDNAHARTLLSELGVAFAMESVVDLWVRKDVACRSVGLLGKGIEGIYIRK